MHASLTVLSGPFAGQTLAVSHGKLLIGREVDCHLRLESPLVSRHHCALLLDDYTLRIRDLGSRNGTFVNEHRIGSGETILLEGDMVVVGDMKCRIDLNGATLPTDGATLPQALERTSVFEGDTVQGDDPNAALPSPPPAPNATV
jgi:pSer/pThr/pTyr-binding forkhead associated (FHA) protein